LDPGITGSEDCGDHGLARVVEIYVTVFTSWVAGLQGECVEEEVQEDDVALGAGGGGPCSGGEAESAD
jgi:hypothetical protein